MKIAIWHNLPSGGGKRALYNHIQGLLALGHSVEVWCPPSADQSFLPLRDLVPEHIVALDLPADSSNPLGRLLTPYRRITGLIKALEAHCRQCASEINAGGFDVLFANTCQFLRNSAIGRFVSIPSLLYLQEPYRRLYEAIPRLPWPALDARWSPRGFAQQAQDALHVRGLRIQAREELRNARAYDRMLCNSLFSRESILRAYGIEAEVCYLGIDLSHLKPLDLPREDVVLSTGAFIPEKNPPQIIKAVNLLPAPRPRLVWIANVANTDLRTWATAYTREHGMEFELRVGVSDSELREWLSRASIFAYAPRLEPFGLAPLEASACATPVVGAAEGGVRETVAHGRSGLLVEPTTAAISQAIQTLRSDPAYARQLGAGGRAWVEERWGNAGAVDRLVGHLEAVMQARQQ